MRFYMTLNEYLISKGFNPDDAPYSYLNIGWYGIEVSEDDEYKDLPICKAILEYYYNRCHSSRAVALQYHIELADIGILVCDKCCMVLER